MTPKGIGLRHLPGNDLAATLDRLVPDGDLGLAVSGGPDSLALLLLAAKARPGRVRAATVDHGLRPESAGEAAMVAELCASLGVPHAVLTVEVAAGASLQAQAREARYSALGAWATREGLAAVATAHHADDQAETLLMRLARGSGVGGLGGVREQRQLTDQVTLVRPLLGWRKAALVALVELAGWTAVEDPANQDLRHDRTRARALLAASDLLDPERLARSATALAEAEKALQAWVALLAPVHVVQEGEGEWRLRALAGLPPECRRRLLLRVLGEAGARRPTGPELDRLLAALEGGSGATLDGWQMSARKGDWLIRRAPPPRTI